MAFNIDKAREMGGTDEQIAEYLAKTRNFDLPKHISAGFTHKEIIDHLSPQKSITAKPPVAEPAPVKKEAPPFIREGPNISLLAPGLINPNLMKPMEKAQPAPVTAPVPRGTSPEPATPEKALDLSQFPKEPLIPSHAPTVTAGPAISPKETLSPPEMAPGLELKVPTEAEQEEINRTAMPRRPPGLYATPTETTGEKVGRTIAENIIPFHRQITGQAEWRSPETPMEVAGWIGMGALAGEMGKAVVGKLAPWLRSLTNKERGLAVQSLEDMLNRGYSEGEVLRRWNSPSWREEALRRRNKGEDFPDLAGEAKPGKLSTTKAGEPSRAGLPTIVGPPAVAEAPEAIGSMIPRLGTPAIIPPPTEKPLLALPPGQGFQLKEPRPKTILRPKAPAGTEYKVNPATGEPEQVKPRGIATEATEPIGSTIPMGISSITPAPKLKPVEAPPTPIPQMMGMGQEMPVAPPERALPEEDARFDIFRKWYMDHNKVTEEMMNPGTETAIKQLYEGLRERYEGPIPEESLAITKPPEPIQPVEAPAEAPVQAESPISTPPEPQVAPEQAQVAPITEPLPTEEVPKEAMQMGGGPIEQAALPVSEGETEKPIKDLKALGYDNSQINRMKPELAAEIVNTKAPAAEVNISQNGDEWSYKQYPDLQPTATQETISAPPEVISPLPEEGPPANSLPYSEWQKDPVLAADAEVAIGRLSNKYPNAPRINPEDLYYGGEQKFDTHSYHNWTVFKPESPDHPVNGSTVNGNVFIQGQPLDTGTSVEANGMNGEVNQENPDGTISVAFENGAMEDVRPEEITPTQPLAGGKVSKEAMPVKAGTTFYHGTATPIEFDAFGGEMAYLSPDKLNAQQFAENPILNRGQTGEQRVISATAKAGKVKDIDTLVTNALENDEDVDGVIKAEAAKAREEGYRYLTFNHPGVEEDFGVTVSLYPKEDLGITQKGKEGQQVSEEGEEKQPWEMTKEEWFDHKWVQIPKKAQKSIVAGEKGFVDTDKIRQQADSEHRNNVERALSEGKPVPKNVLIEYPDLAKKETPAHLQRFPESSQRPTPQNIKDEIVRLYQENIGIIPIRNKLGISQRTIYRALNEANIPIRERGNAGGTIKSDIRDEVERLYTGEKYSTTEIGNRLGINPVTALSILKERGIQPRTRSEAGAISVQKRGIGSTKRGLSAPWFSEKNDAWIRADSRYEIVRMSQLDNDPNVVSWTKSMEQIPYGEGRYYSPDLYIVYSNGKKVVEEIKPRYRVSEENVIEKEKAARKYFGDKGIEYKIITQDDIGIDNLRNFDYESIPLLTAEEKQRFRAASSKSDYPDLAKQTPPEFQKAEGGPVDFHTQISAKPYDTRGAVTALIVDGNYIRKNIDPEFTNFAQHYDKKYVPGNEVWLDKEYGEDEYPYLLDNAITQRRMMSEGMSYDEALKRGDAIEKRERERSEPSKVGKGKPTHKLVLDATKEILGTIGKGKIQVLLVNGDMIRDAYPNLNFTEGGNDGAYPWVPKNTVIIDNQISPEERPAIIVHEGTERDRIVNQGMKYPEAHKLSSQDEHEYREDPAKFEASKKGAGVKLEVAPVEAKPSEKPFPGIIEPPSILDEIIGEEKKPTTISPTSPPGLGATPAKEVAQTTPPGMMPNLPKVIDLTDLKMLKEKDVFGGKVINISGEKYIIEKKQHGSGYEVLKQYSDHRGLISHTDTIQQAKDLIVKISQGVKKETTSTQGEIEKHISDISFKDVVYEGKRYEMSGRWDDNIVLTPINGKDRITVKGKLILKVRPFNRKNLPAVAIPPGLSTPAKEAVNVQPPGMGFIVKNIPLPKKPKPSTDLLGWVREQGGIDPNTAGADVGALTQKESGFKGKSSLVRKGGKSFDILAQVAEMEGMVPPGTTTDEFAEMIKDRVQGYDKRAANIKKERLQAEIDKSQVEWAEEQAAQEEALEAERQTLLKQDPDFLKDETINDLTKIDDREIINLDERLDALREELNVQGATPDEIRQALDKERAAYPAQETPTDVEGIKKALSAKPATEVKPELSAIAKDQFALPGIKQGLTFPSKGGEATPTLEGSPLMEAARKAEVEKVQPELGLTEKGHPKYPNGYLIPKEGDKVFQQVAGPFVTPAYVHGEVFQNTKGELRVRVTGGASLMGGQTKTGKTYPADQYWKVEGDPELKRREEVKTAKEEAYADQIRKEREESDLATKQGFESSVAQGYEPVTSENVKPGDVIIDHRHNTRNVVTEIYKNEVYARPENEPDQSGGYIGMAGETEWTKVPEPSPETKAGIPETKPEGAIEEVAPKTTDEPEGKGGKKAYEMTKKEAESSEPLYHGSKTPIVGKPKVSKGDLTIGKGLMAIPGKDIFEGFYASPNPDYAKMYSMGGKEAGVVQQVWLSPDAKVLDLSKDIVSQEVLGASSLARSPLSALPKPTKPFPFQTEFDAYAKGRINAARVKNGHQPLSDAEYAKRVGDQFNPASEDFNAEGTVPEYLSDFVKGEGYDAVKFQRETIILNPDKVTVGSHKEIVKQALTSGDLTPEAYTRLHEKDYGPIEEFGAKVQPSAKGKEEVNEEAKAKEVPTVRTGQRGVNLSKTEISSEGAGGISGGGGQNDQGMGGLGGRGEGITDFGQHIGGSRKDIAERGYTMSKAAKTEEAGPAWKKRFVAMEKVKEPGQWIIHDTKAGDFQTRTGQVFSSQEEAEKAIPLYAVARQHTVYPNKDNTYSIFKKVSDRKRLKVVNQDFPSREEAMKYMATHAEDILNTKTTFGEEILPTPEKVYRKGAERRTKDATAEMFTETFAPRGIEFGNWNNQEERQQVMNHAYDALLDLADALNLPPKSLMLNGELAIAFGARGHGLTGAKAHYERDYGVINLTKMKGAGSLGHELFHAMDHYFGRLDTKAKSEKVKNELGNLVFPAQSVSADYLSHGPSYKSELRPELKEAYQNLMDTIYSKGEQYVEDTKKADQFLGKARENLRNILNEARQELQRDMTAYSKAKGGFRRSEKGLRPASDEQLLEFDRLSNILVEGGDLELKHKPNEKVKGGWGGRMTNDTLESLNSIWKAIRNREGFRKEGHGSLDRVRAAMTTYKERLKMFEDAKKGTEKTKKVPTSYAIEAKKMDQARSGNYWSEPHEMVARAFSSYVEDKIAEQGGQSDFLVYQAKGGILLPMIDGFIARPYPEGPEREAINKAFDKFVKTLKTKGEGGEMLYSAVPLAIPFLINKGEDKRKGVKDQRREYPRPSYLPPGLGR